MREQTCPYCHRIIIPIVNGSLLPTKTCPLCRNVVSDDAGVKEFRKTIMLTQEDQYLHKAFEAESRGLVELKDELLKWAEERRHAAEEVK